MTRYYFDEPECPECGKTMVRITDDNLYICEECEETMTRDAWENVCQSRAEKAAERAMENAYGDSVYQSQRDALRIKRDMR